MNEYEIHLQNASFSDPKIKMKVGKLQRYAKSLAKRLLNEINANGAYENAGENEFLEWDNRKNQYEINDYQLECDLNDMTKNLFYLVGCRQIGLNEINEFSYK